MQWLAKKVRQQLPQVIAPCLIMHSGHDDIANINTNARLVEENVSGPTRFVVLDDSYHLITIDRQRREVINESVQFFQNITQSASLNQAL